MKRELVLKEEGQEYGQITKNLGNSRLEVQCANGSKVIGVIRGAIRRKMWICVGDIVLVGLRDYEDGKVDIISRYTPEEAKELIKEKHIPPTMQAREDDEGGRGNGQVDFVNEMDERSSSDEDSDAGPAQPRRGVLPPMEDDDDQEVDVDAI